MPFYCCIWYTCAQPTQNVKSAEDFHFKYTTTILLQSTLRLWLWQSLILIFVCHKIVKWFNQRNQLRVITFKYAFTIVIKKSRELISTHAKNGQKNSKKLIHELCKSLPFLMNLFLFICSLFRKFCVIMIFIRRWIKCYWCGFIRIQRKYYCILCRDMDDKR